MEQTVEKPRHSVYVVRIRPVLKHQRQYSYEGDGQSTSLRRVKVNSFSLVAGLFVLIFC